MPKKEQEEVWQICFAMRSACVDLLKAHGRREETPLIQIMGRSLLHLSLRFVHGEFNPELLWTPSCPNWYLQEQIFPLGQGVYVPGMVKNGKEGEKLPARVYTVTAGSIEEALAIRFLIAGANEHLVFRRDGVHIGIGPIGPDFQHNMRDFQARILEPDEIGVWQEKWQSFQTTPRG